jgi:hypothetical protein
MEKKMKGKVAQFGTKGYGFIAGDDGEKYFVATVDTQIPKKVNLLPLHLPKKEARLSVIAGNLVSTTIPDSHLIL